MANSPLSVAWVQLRADGSQLANDVKQHSATAGKAAGDGVKGGFVSGFKEGAREVIAEADATGTKAATGFRGSLQQGMRNIVGDGKTAGEAHGKAFGEGATRKVKEEQGKLRETIGEGFKASLAGLSAGLIGLGTIEVFKHFIEGAADARKASAITAQVIATTGGAAHVTADDVDRLALAISNKTGIDDDQIHSSENLLLTFTNVRNELGKGNDIFNQATGLVQDMSVALGQDAKSSAIQLGKALNDPIKGVTALQRVGVSFTQSQRDQIKVLVQSGNVLGAQKIILGEVGREFGGAAEAAATPLQKLTTRIDNLGKAGAGALLPVIDKIATVMADDLIPAVAKVGSLIASVPAPVYGLAAAFGVLRGTMAALAAVGGVQGIIGGLRFGLVGLIGVLSNPWVLAFAAGATALTLFIHHQEDAKAAADQLRGSLNTTTGAVTEQTRAMVVASLQQQGILGVAEQLGINLADVTDAALGNADAYNAIRAQLGPFLAENNRVRGVVGYSTQALSGNADQANRLLDAIDGSSKGIREQRDALRQQQAAAAESTRQTKAASAATSAQTALQLSAAAANTKQAVALSGQQAAAARAARANSDLAHSAGGIVASAVAEAAALARSTVAAGSTAAAHGRLAVTSGGAERALHAMDVAAGKSASSTGLVVAGAFNAAGALAREGIASVSATAATARHEAALRARATAEAVAKVQTQLSAAEKVRDTLAQKAETAALTAWLTKLDQQLNRFLGLRGAQRDYKQALDDATKSIKDNGRNLDINSAKGRANQASLDNVASSAGKVLDQMQANTRGGPALRSEWERQRSKLFDVARQFGLNKGAALDYVNNALGKVPPSVNTKVNTPGLSTAQQNIRKFQLQIEALKGKNLEVVVDSHGTALLRDTTHAGKAAGGLISGPGGPKDDKAGLFRLSNGEFVVNAQATSRHREVLEAINSGRPPGMAAGGVVRTVNVNTRANMPQASWVANFLGQIDPMVALGGGGPIPTGTSIARWAPMMRLALARMGLPLSLLPNELRQIQTESGGNPNAVQGNIGDINNATGDLAKGLLQVIGATFRAFHVPGTSNSVFDPWANMLASLSYQKSRYGPGAGSIAAAIGHGHGYDSGGLARSAGLIPKPTNAPERVLSPRQTEAFEAAMGRGFAGQAPPVVHVYIGEEEVTTRVRVVVDDAFDTFGRRLDYGYGTVVG